MSSHTMPSKICRYRLPAGISGCRCRQRANLMSLALDEQFLDMAVFGQPIEAGLDIFLLQLGHALWLSSSPGR